MARTRRSVLAALPALAGGVVSGCAAPVGGDTASDAVSLLVAGSLADALENGLRPPVEVPLRIEAHGSAAVARLVAEGQRDPNVVSLADVALFDGPLHPAWYAEFATNALVLAYNPDADGGRQLADATADDWFRPLLDGSVRVGRTDPDLDPLGYRTLFVLDLATGYYDTDADLREAILQPNQIYPETQLVSQFETGSIDAAFAYRSMAVDRGYEFVDLPSAINLSDPDRADAYATATYTLPDGKTVRGGAVSYASTVRAGNRRDAVDVVFETHTTGDYLTDFGFTVPSNYPRYTGDAPDALTD